MARSRPEIRYVNCRECRKGWRYGCPECADDFAQYHRETFEHDVSVNAPLDEDTHRSIRNIFSQPRLRNWWVEP